MEKNTKFALFHGTHNNRWYDVELTQKPKDTIETPFGLADVTVNEDYSISCEVIDLHVIWGVSYKIQGTLYLNRNTESWTFSNATMRAISIEPDYTGLNWKPLTPSSPTSKARQKINKSLQPTIETWAEKNWQQLGAGKSIGYINKIEQARAKIADIQKKLDMRTEWLDQIEKEFNKTGVINEDSERLDLYGRYWRFG